MAAWRRSGIVVVLAVVACALGGCGASTGDQVKAKVRQFAHAVATRDAKTLCEQVLAPALLERFAAVGVPCVKAMHTFLATVKDPTLATGRVVVNGSKAEILTLSSARGQVGALSAVELVDTPNGWRVSGLGSPLLPKK